MELYIGSTENVLLSCCYKEYLAVVEGANFRRSIKLCEAASALRPQVSIMIEAYLMFSLFSGMILVLGGINTAVFVDLFN